jgi:hypothetical protein
MKRFAIHIFATALVVVGSCTRFYASQPAEPPLPDLQTVLRKAVERAKSEDQNDRAFKEHYGYKRLKISEERNGQGRINKHEERISPHMSQAQVTIPASAKAPSQSGSNKALDKNDFPLNQDTLSRFQFNMARREIFNNRPTLVVDFKPKEKNSAKSYKDYLMNRAAGRIWLDEKECALVKADVHLTESISIVGGLVGSVKKFWYHLDRERTPEGYWFSRFVNWHVEFREFLAHKILEHKEQNFDLRKLQ